MVQPRRVRPPRPQLIPPPLPPDAWRAFFIAARTLVARRQRRTRGIGLLELWDRSARQFAGGLFSDFVTYEGLLAFDVLIRIMEGAIARTCSLRDPEADYERTKQLLKRVRQISKSAGPLAYYTPLKAKWAHPPVGLPDQPIPPHSPQFCRIALSQLFCEEEELKTLHDTNLLEVLKLDKTPAKQAQEVLAAVYGSTQPYIAQRISNLRRARRRQRRHLRFPTIRTPNLPLEYLGQTHRRRA